MNDFENESKLCGYFVISDHEIVAAAMLHDAESEGMENAQLILKKSVGAMFEDD